MRHKRTLALPVIQTLESPVCTSASDSAGCFDRRSAAPVLGDPMPEDPTETPIQRALRMKTAALEARPKPPRGGRFQREQAASVATGKSKPWLTK
jgi:hypothetical protein